MNQNEVYILFSGLKLHFSGDYDYFKYKGKLKNRKCPEKYSFMMNKLYKKYGDKITDFFVANLIVNDKLWVNNLLSEECDKIYKEFLKKQESLSYQVKNDLINLTDEYDNFNDIFNTDGGFPPLMKKVIGRQINIETVIVLNYYLNFLNSWDSKIDDDLIWKPFKMKCEKLSPFITFDKSNMKSVIKTALKG